jgi:hypothetical protein
MNNDEFVAPIDMLRQLMEDKQDIHRQYARGARGGRTE